MSKDRHSKVTVQCEYCGKSFEAREERVRVGQGRFCSKSCSSAGSVLGTSKKYVGKENACVRWNEKGNRYDVYWFDPVTLKRTNTTYAKWWYELNIGEVPLGHKVGYRDGNPKNIDPDNIYAQSPADFGSKMSKLLMGHVLSDETKEKIGASHRGTTLTDEHKQKIGNQTKRMWQDGVFDDPEIREAYSRQGKSTKGNKWTDEQRKKISDARKGKDVSWLHTPEALAKRVAKLVGRKQSEASNLKRSQTQTGKEFSEEHIANLKKTARRGADNPFWKGGVSKIQYPPEFDNQLKKKIRIRDGYLCQACGENLYRSVRGHIHHIDADKQNSDEDNLILLCKSCHRSVHNLEVAGMDVVDALEKVILDFKSRQN